MSGCYCPVGHDIWVGNYDYCNHHSKDFDLVIHVTAHKPQHGRCAAFDSDEQRGFFIQYDDLTSLSTAIPLESPLSDQKQIQRIAAYARQPGRLLSHCAAGMCRGPTMAILAKCARGCLFPDAVRDVVNGMWLGYQTAPFLGRVPMTEIARWAWDGART